MPAAHAERGAHAPGSSLDTVRDDFDRIAILPRETVDHGERLYPWLLRHLPQPCGPALDVGCGTGHFSRRLAGRTRNVVGLDLSTRMIDVARESSPGVANLEFRVGDVMNARLPERSWDAVAAIAMLHHVALREGLERLASLVAPRGVLLVLDLYDERDWSQLTRTALSWLMQRGQAPFQPPIPREVRQAWQSHGAHDRYPKMSEVRRAAGGLPGARIRTHLFWRWSLVWRRD